MATVSLMWREHIVSDMEIPDFVRADLLQLDIALNDEALQRLGRYLQLLLEANRRFNLTAVREPEAAWRRHIIDSLTVLPGLEPLAPGAGVIDVGSGGGLPGIPLAIARPELSMTLLEATGKKAKFLQSCITDVPLANVQVVNARAEQAGQDEAHRERYDAVVCRAVGPMRELLEYTLPLARLGGVLLAMKGPSVEGELADAGDALDILGAGEIEVYGAYPDEFGQDTVIVQVGKDRPTPAKYPRAAGLPRQMPLGGKGKARS